MTIVEMKEERARVFEQLKALNDSVLAEEREFNGEEEAAYDKMNAEMDQLALDISKAEKDERIETLRKSLVDNKTPKAQGPRTPDEELWDKARAFCLGETKHLEVPFAEQRDLLTTGTGANAIPVSFVRSLREHLIDNSAMRQTNATVLTTEGGEPLKVPKTTTHPTAGIIGEAATITESDPVLGQVTLDSYKYAYTQQLSREFVTDEVVNVLEYLSRISGTALGNGSGAHFVTGTGSAQPNGVVTAAIAAASNIVTGATGTTTTVTSDSLIDLYHKPVTGYRANSWWMMRDATVAAVRKIKETTGQYLWQPGLQVGQPDTLLGRPVVADPNVAAMAANAYSIVFGDFSTYYIRDVGPVLFERSDDFAFATDLVTFRAILRTDGDLIDTNGIALYRNSAT